MQRRLRAHARSETQEDADLGERNHEAHGIIRSLMRHGKPLPVLGALVCDAALS